MIFVSYVALSNEVSVSDPEALCVYLIFSLTLLICHAVWNILGDTFYQFFLVMSIPSYLCMQHLRPTMSRLVDIVQGVLKSLLFVCPWYCNGVFQQYKVSVQMELFLNICQWRGTLLTLAGNAWLYLRILCIHNSIHGNDSINSNVVGHIL